MPNHILSRWLLEASYIGTVCSSVYVGVQVIPRYLSSCMALQGVLKELPGELAAQEEHVREMGKALKARKGLWRCTRSTMVGAYLQHCILPRVTYSPADAAFCAAFMRRLIELSVPWFHAFLYLDAVSAMWSSDTTHSDAQQFRFQWCHRS